MGRGQSSIESLLVFLIFLSLLGSAYLASSKLGQAAQRKMDWEFAKSSFADFFSKLESACSLGNGNVRQVELARGQAAIYAEGKAATFTSSSFVAQANSSCELSVIQTGQSNKFTIKNVGGKIEIS